MSHIHVTNIHRDKRYNSTPSLIKPPKLSNINETIDSDTTVICVTESRAREVCITCLDSKNVSELDIYLFTDNHSYVESIGIIEDIQPNEILLHDGSRNSTLSKKIENVCTRNDKCRALFISRQYFDQDRGAEMLQRVLHSRGDADLIAKYTVLGSSYCILRYIENCSGVIIADKSMRLNYCSSTLGNRVNIDRGTIINLELVSNLNGTQKDSLFSVMNFTKTIVGARLLRHTIISPITDLPTLSSRLDVVQQLLNEKALVDDIYSSLSSLPDLDKMLNGLVTTPKFQTVRAAKRGIDTMIFIKQTVKEISRLVEKLKILIKDDANSSLLKTLVIVLNSSEIWQIQAIIENVLCEETSFSRSYQEMQHQECFALKSGIHGELDVARKAYLQTVEDINQLAEQYSDKYNFTVKVAYNNKRGYHLTIPSQLQNLPDIFIQNIQNFRTISCTTDEIMSLSDRANENISASLTITQQLIQGGLELLRAKIEYLFNLSDSVAMIDMLISFAQLIKSSDDTFSRPIFSINRDSSTIFIGARHPVVSLHKTFSRDSFVANDLILSSFENVYIITGPNGSGKTVLLKQVAILTIMGQTGCYVPATHATIAIRDRIMSRIGTSDDMEHNLSTFATEMKDAAYLVSNITNRSLVIVDELGRGTSNLDGLSLAFAIVEAFVQSRALTLFVTHYPQLTCLPNIYRNVKNIHLKTNINSEPDTIGNSKLKYFHVIEEGPSDLNAGYGVMLAEMCGFPNEIVSNARRYVRVVRDQYPLLVNISTVDNAAISAKELLQRLIILRCSGMNNSALRSYLNNLRQKISFELSVNIAHSLIFARNVENEQYFQIRQKLLEDQTYIKSEVQTSTTYSKKFEINCQNETISLPFEPVKLEDCSNQRIALISPVQLENENQMDKSV